MSERNKSRLRSNSLFVPHATLQLRGKETKKKNKTWRSIPAAGEPHIWTQEKKYSIPRGLPPTSLTEDPWWWSCEATWRRQWTSSCRAGFRFSGQPDQRDLKAGEEEYRQSFHRSVNLTSVSLSWVNRSGNYLSQSFHGLLILTSIHCRLFQIKLWTK